MNDMFAEPEPEPEPEPQIESSPKIGSDPLLSELVDIMDEAAEMHPHQFDDSDLPPEAYMDNDDYSEVPIDVQVQQDSQPQVKAVSHDTLDDLLSLRDELSAPATTPEITPTVQLQTAEQESTEREPAELEIVPLPPVAPSSSANADESEEPSQPLAQPERDPSKMGLVHHEDMPAVNFQQVQAEQLTAILPNGDKLTSAAQIDEWANTISKLNLGGLNKQLAIHSAFQRNANTVTLLLDEQKGHLQSVAAIDVVCTALSNHFGEPINVNVTCGQPTHTPFSLQMQINQIRKAHAEAIFNSDPELQKLKNTFGASVVDGSLKPKP